MDGLINNHLPDFSFMSFIATAGIAWLPQQHKKMPEQTEDVAYNISISLTFDNKTALKTKTLVTKLMLAASQLLCWQWRQR